MILSFQMIFNQFHVIVFINYLIAKNIVNARPLNNQLDLNDLQEEQISTGFFNQPYTLESNHSNNDETNPSEVQKAVCTVTAGDVKASAEAVTTKTLKGVCGSAEMLSAFNNLENKLDKELQNIRKLLVLIQQQNRIGNNNNNDQMMSENSNALSAISTTTVATTPITPTFLKHQHTITHENKNSGNDTNKSYSMSPKYKSLQNKKDIRSNISLTAPVREHEISMFNNTLLTDKDIKVFTYYWRMENFTTKIKNENSISIESPIFSIKGKAFKIKANFQHLHRDFLFLQLEDLSSSSQVNFGNSIILDTGGIFKEIDSNNLKYKISILDQNKKRSKDLVSQEFHNHQKGFQIPNSALLDSSFIKDDALLIQIFLYL